MEKVRRVDRRALSFTEDTHPRIFSPFSLIVSDGFSSNPIVTRCSYSSASTELKLSSGFCLLSDTYSRDRPLSFFCWNFVPRLAEMTFYFWIVACRGSNGSVKGTTIDTVMFLSISNQLSCIVRANEEFNRSIKI